VFFLYLPVLEKSLLQEKVVQGMQGPPAMPEMGEFLVVVVAVAVAEPVVQSFTTNTIMMLSLPVVSITTTKIPDLQEARAVMHGLDQGVEVAEVEAPRAH
jgi:hypothetical protein